MFFIYPFEQEQDGAEQSDDTEDIKELVVEEERGINELHASSTVDKTIDEVSLKKISDFLL